MIDWDTEARRTLGGRLAAVADELRAANGDYATALLLATEAEIAARREAECLVAIRADVAVRAHGFVRETTRGDKAILAPERDALVAATIQRDPTYDVPAASARCSRATACPRCRCTASGTPTPRSCCRRGCTPGWCRSGWGTPPTR